MHDRLNPNDSEEKFQSDQQITLANKWNRFSLAYHHLHAFVKRSMSIPGKPHANIHQQIPRGFLNRLPAVTVKYGIFAHLPPETLSSLSKTNKNFHQLLKESANAGMLLQKLLRHIVRGEQETAEQIIKNDCGLLSQKARVTDYSGRDFLLAPLQAATWARDRHMQKMIKQYLPDAVVDKQLAELAKMPSYTLCLMEDTPLADSELEENTLYVKKIMLPFKNHYDNATRETVLEYRVKTPTGDVKTGRISEEELGQVIEKPRRKQRGTIENALLRERELEELHSRLAAILIVTTARNHTRGHGPRFDAGPQRVAYQAYMDAFNVTLAAMEAADDFSGDIEPFLRVVWLEVSWQQRFLPAAWWNEFCRTDRAFDPLPEFDDEHMPRCLMLRDNVPLLPLKPFSGLGFEFGLFRYAGARGARTHKEAVGCRLKYDFAAIGRLDEVTAGVEPEPHEQQLPFSRPGRP
jgi:hypothetical protein